MKKREIIFFAILLIIAIASLLLMQFFNKGDQKEVHIEVDGEHYDSFSLTSETNMTFSIETELGVNKVVVSDGGVDVVSADCKAQVCVNTKKATEINDLIVCLPHKVFIEIVKETK